MLHENIEAADPIDAEIESALEDVALEISEVRVITKRMIGLRAGSASYRADNAQLHELMSRIDSRARRVELSDGDLSADGLLQFANVRDRQRRRQSPNRRPGTARALHEDYLQAVAREGEALQVHTKATSDLMEAQRHRRATEEAYRAHGTSRLTI